MRNAGDLASPAQIKFIRRLAEERVVPTELHDPANPGLDDFTRKDARWAIDLLLASPRKDGRDPNAASPKQMAFLERLLDERQANANLAANARALIAAGLTREDASKYIDLLLAEPAKAAAREKEDELPDVPAGRYAIIRTGPPEFYKIDRPTRGKWAGYTFVAREHGENHEPIKDRTEKAFILHTIAGDLEGAARLYGHHKNHCGFCRKGLTDPFSRYFGVGPVCRREHGFPISAAAFVKRAEAAGDKAALNDWAAWELAGRTAGSCCLPWSRSCSCRPRTRIINEPDSGDDERQFDSAIARADREDEERAQAAKWQRDRDLGIGG